MNRLFKFLTAIVPFIAAEAIQYFLYSIFIFINGYITIPDSLLYTIQAGIILVCGVIFFFWYRFEIQGEIRGSLKNVLTVKNIFLFIMLGVGCQLFFTGAMTLIKPLFTQAFSNYSNLMEDLTSGNEVVVLFLLTIIAPVTEELIFRGVTLHRANRYITFLGANFLQAILFGIYHGNIIQGVYAFLLGFLLGVIYYKYKTIFAPVLLHIIINTSSLFVVLVPEATLNYIIITLLGGILIVFTLLIIQPAKEVKLQSIH